ncbi:Rieske (2Fe-2S) protein [Armatimonas sp.]|uniref:Rieske (2Fe-2S) protein n=1 Tax=Armatimonas sp. TaxID=1872638 RepID=UPI0037522DB8
MSDYPSDYPNGFGSENEALDTAFRIIDEAKPPKARQRGRLVVCIANALGIGQKRVVTDPETGVSIGVFNISGEFFAIKNICPHQGAPLCQGSVHGTHRPSPVFTYRPDLQGRVLRCPWHGWEFDIVTGKALYDASSRVATYVCEVNSEGDLVVLL